jgi:hypothetical protein
MAATVFDLVTAISSFFDRAARLLGVVALRFSPVAGRIGAFDCKLH